MKLIVYLALAAMTFISCKKDNCDPSPVGKWDWVKALGGLAGLNLTPQNTGKTWQLTLNSNGTASQSGDLFAAGSGSYTLVEDNSSGTLQKKLNLVINGEETSFTYSFESNNRLRLDENVAADGLSYFLVRN